MQTPHVRWGSHSMKSPWVDRCWTDCCRSSSSPARKMRKGSSNLQWIYIEKTHRSITLQHVRYYSFVIWFAFFISWFVHVHPISCHISSQFSPYLCRNKGGFTAHAPPQPELLPAAGRHRTTGAATGQRGAKFERPAASEGQRFLEGNPS